LRCRRVLLRAKRLAWQLRNSAIDCMCKSIQYPGTEVKIGSQENARRRPMVVSGADRSREAAGRAAPSERNVALGGFARPSCRLPPAFAHFFGLRFPPGAANRKSGQSSHVFLFTGKNSLRGGIFHPHFSILHPLWPRRSRRVWVLGESRFFVRFLPDRCKPFPRNWLEQDQVP